MRVARISSALVVVASIALAQRGAQAQPHPRALPNQQEARPIATRAPSSAVGSSAPRRETPPAASPAPGGTVVRANTSLHRGDFVAIEWNGSWYAGRVVSLASGNRVRVHYDGYGDDQDETVTRARLHLAPTAWQPRPSPVDPSGAPVFLTTTIAPGSALEINWHGQWWAGHATATLPDGQVIVHYDGWDAASDEIVTRDRLLTPRAGRPVAVSPTYPPGRPVDAQSPIALGDAVHIEWQRSYYPGRVVALLPDGTVRVHYTGYGSESDENVSRERLRIGIVRPVVIAPPAQ